MSGYLQELCCYAGQSMVFEEASVFIGRYLNITISGKQIERVCHFYGGKIEQGVQEMIKKQEAVQKKAGKGIVYVMVDGAMVLTREKKWKEIKLGRVFDAESRIEVNKGRKLITQSKYMAHLGEHAPFEEKMATLIDSIPFKIFIGDGAKWIWIWVDSDYPEAIQILDYFHAKEHLCDFAVLYFGSDTDGKNEWIKQQEDLLFNDNVELVIGNIRSLPKSGKKAVRKAQNALVSYYEQNKKRMLYKTYRNMGLMIGSGPIEAANRHVIQHRMKRSGQRWTIDGLQQVANLRVVHKSDEWDTVLGMINMAA
jgi:ribosomal protein L24E